MTTTFATSLHALLGRDDAEALAAGGAAPPRLARDLAAAGVAPGDRVALLYPREDGAYDVLAAARVGPAWTLRPEGGRGVVAVESVRHRTRALDAAEVARLDAALAPRRGSVARMVAPHVHRSPSDLRYRVHDGEQFVAVYEPEEQHLADDHLQRILATRRGRRRAAPAPPPRDLVLELDAVPVARRGTTAPAPAEDMDRVHVKQMSDGWKVWHPGVRAYVTGPDFTPYATKAAAMERARDIMVQIGATAARPKGRAGAAKAPRGAVEVAPGAAAGTLFAPAEMVAKGGQMGFKFNGRKRNRLGAETAQEVDWTRRQLLGRRVRLTPRGGGFAVDGFVREVRFAAADGVAVVLDGVRHPFRLADYAVEIDPRGRKRNAPQLPSGRRGALAAPPPMPPYEEFPIGRAVARDDLAQRRRRAVEEYEALDTLRVEHF